MFDENDDWDGMIAWGEATPKERLVSAIFGILMFGLPCLFIYTLTLLFK